MNSESAKAFVQNTLLETSFFQVNKRLVKELGFVEAGILCNYLNKQKYFEYENPKNDGWFFLSHKKQMDELNIGDFSIRKVKMFLIEKGILQTKKEGVPPIEWLRIDYELLYTILQTKEPTNELERCFQRTRTLFSTDNIKNKDIKKIVEETIVSSPSLRRVKKDAHITINFFEKFWEIYPRKDGKGKAFKKWSEFCTQKSKEKLRPTWETIKTAIEQQKQSERWQQPQFIPLPATWLNETRWVDDPNEMKTFKKGTEKQINNGSHFSGVKSTFKKSEKL
jgi:hypothetical protein